MSFISERYSIAKRNSGKWGLRGKYGWYLADSNKVKVFETRQEAVAFFTEKKNEELKSRAAKHEYNEMIEKLVNEFIHDNENGTATVKRNFKTYGGNEGYIEWNNGFTKRSLNCVTLYIGGDCIFTSGTIRKVVEYIVTH